MLIPSFNKPWILSLTFAINILGIRLAYGIVPPEPTALFDSTLNPPAISYQGQVMVTQWYGKQTRAEELRVYSLPPNKIRREFLSPDGRVTRITISDGETESVNLIRAKKTMTGDAVRSYEKVLAPEIERSTLLENYILASSTGANVAGRPTWCLTIKPRINGKPWQRLWVDQATHIVLRSKRYLPNRSFASEAQFSSFEPNKQLDPSLFQVEVGTGVAKTPTLDPDFLTLNQLNETSGKVSVLPQKLPGGFVFESADVFPVGKSMVRHARYTDGLIVISLFQTDVPVRLPKNGSLPPGSLHLPGPLIASRAGKVIQWHSRSNHFTLMGDVSKELIADIIKSVR